MTPVELVPIKANRGPRSSWRCVARNHGNRCRFRSGHEGPHQAFGVEFR